MALTQAAQSLDALIGHSARDAGGALPVAAVQPARPRAAATIQPRAKLK
jgi:hypothetical protein